MRKRAVVLASESPRRRALLAKTGIPFRVDASRYDEETSSGLSPRTFARSLSRHKADSVATRHKNAVIIAADTFIVFRRRIFGKPSGPADARRMLGILNGRTHTVVTGFTIIDTGTGKSLSRTVETKVFFRKMTSREIEAYVRSGEPLGKAGAYAIQGLGAAFVRKIEGDYYNVVGLPLDALVRALRKFGITPP